ncbi:MAG: peptidoglycan DD-metalloendopeptidase family protein [Actinomycetota bacterium]|nr:peptidoglycan DD-metalloendopeptidase family protein [Actinomycetota bacterium]MEC8119389.1 peptidoglycan DD-metalloendopeptidase family protein [Actinomycetota bacterium]
MGPSMRMLKVSILLAIGTSLLLPASALIAQDDNEVIEEAKEQRELKRQEQLAAEAEIALLEAEDLEVVAALEAATSLVNLQEAKAQAAEQRLQAALDTKIQAQEDFLAIASEIEEIEQRALTYAVESYIGMSDRRTEAWFEAEDATIAAHKIALLDLISSNTNDVLDQLKLIQEERSYLLTKAAVAQEEADAIREELEQVRVELDAQKAVREEIKKELDVRRAHWDSVLATAVEEQQEITDFIAAEEERIARELEEARRRAELEARLGEITEAGWVLPSPGAITSWFGPRLHPILGYTRMHNGVDFNCWTGDPIRSATDGIVIMAQYYGGYGYTIIVQHANSLSTLYAHLSAFNSQVNDYVVAGQQIGQCGTTGLSTGPHLHFEVRQSGAPVNPLPYLP